MIDRLVLRACALLALVFAVAFAAVAVHLFRSHDAATCVVPCALAVLMGWLAVEIGWGDDRRAAEETALASREEAPTPAGD